REGEDGRHHPPGADARVEVVDNVAALFQFDELPDDRGDDEERENAAEKHQRLPVANHVYHCRSSRIALRARSRNAFLSSSSRTCIGSPKLTEASIGTGTNSPFGRTRLRLLRYVGISSTSGRALPSRYKPLLNGAIVAPSPRVPSGKM